jgi:hypothetical protein
MARTIIAGLLVGYGFVSFFCFLILDEIWFRDAPSQANEALGLVCRHNEHGIYRYFSQFQATTCGLMFMTSIPLVFVGMLIAQKKKIVGKAVWYAATFTWDQGHPGPLAKWSALVAAAATPLFVFFVGPYIIRGLSAVGFMMNLC